MIGVERNPLVPCPIMGVPVLMFLALLAVIVAIA
jgi:hypothetical protein